jgi:hypothetical protein
MNPANPKSPVWFRSPLTMGISSAAKIVGTPMGGVLKIFRTPLAGPKPPPISAAGTGRESGRVSKNLDCPII